MKIINKEKYNDEKDIWSRIKKGDQKALGKLYELYIDELFAYGITLNSDKNRVLDSIHDLFVDLYKYRSKLANTSNVKFYLLLSLKRKIFKDKSKEFVLFENSKFLSNEFDINDDNSAEEKIIENELLIEKSDMLQGMLNSLSKTQRLGLKLRFYQNKSYKEIAEILNISESSARTTIYRAIKELRKISSLMVLIILFLLLF
ncbi:RNA polymerase sigma factor [Seonamhaeicola marinus]|uniref:RNA polymerase sigma factor n=1 Tax=Seonamhaeicola marinus TaxID=1912246 RepID=UPI001652362C|nr:RNA polymerase sigma factor [Seonamhaeicola marinus]